MTVPPSFVSWRPPRWREYRHHFDVPAAALTADEPAVLGHVNEDHFVPELQLLKRLHRLMIAAEAMHRASCFAAGARGFVAPGTKLLWMCTIGAALALVLDGAPHAANLRDRTYAKPLIFDDQGA